MIAAFAWVVIGDLVNMHMKIIYEKDLSAHNTLFTKTISKDKSSHKAAFKTINSSHSVSYFINPNGVEKFFIPIFDIDFCERVFYNKVSLLNSTCHLRGPPSV